MAKTMFKDESVHLFLTPSLEQLSQLFTETMTLVKSGNYCNCCHLSVVLVYLSVSLSARNCRNIAGPLEILAEYPCFSVLENKR